MMNLNGALLVNKPAGVSSFFVVEQLQRSLQKKAGLKRRELPKIGHGGTLDPFATGLLLVCVGRGSKLARYFLGSKKSYSGTIRFGETTISGDFTNPITERTDVIPPANPSSLEQMQKVAHQLTSQPYLQTPPMHSAKKKDGKPLYELARQGIEIDREPKACRLYHFTIQSYRPPRAVFEVSCSAGTYIRVLAQDFARILGTLGGLESLTRTASGPFSLACAQPLDEIVRVCEGETSWDELPCWIPFDRMLEKFPSVEATEEERSDLFHGKQSCLFSLVRRVRQSPNDEPHLAIFCRNRLIAVAARSENGIWMLERVFSAREED